MVRIKKIKRSYFIFAAALILVAGFFLWLAVVPFGKISYQTDFRGHYILGGRGFIEKFSPLDRVEAKPVGGGFKVIGDPVYFSLFTPRTFDRARLIITYENKLSDKTPIIEAGVLTDKLVWQYQSRPLENKLIDNLGAWDVNNYKDVNIYCHQQELADVPVTAESLCSYNPQALATYNYRLFCPFKLLGYEENSNKHGFPTPIRGDWQVYAYIKDEILDWEISIRDLNRNRNRSGDPIELGVYDQSGNKIFTSLMDDDGIVEDSGVESKTRTIRAEIKNLPEGVYRVVLKTNDDIVSEIFTKQSKVVFINKIWPFLAVDKNSPDRPLLLYSDASRVKARTVNPAARQIFSFGHQSAEIKEAYFPFEIFSPLQSGEILNLLSLSRPDLLVEANGFFSFTSEAFFRPEPWRLDKDTDLDQFRCLAADYQAPDKNNDTIIASAEFDLKSAYREEGRYSFMISAPGLRSDDGQDDYLHIKAIKIELQGRTLWAKLGELLAKIF